MGMNSSGRLDHRFEDLVKMVPSQPEHSAESGTLTSRI